MLQVSIIFQIISTFYHYFSQIDDEDVSIWYHNKFIILKNNSIIFTQLNDIYKIIKDFKNLQKDNYLIKDFNLIINFNEVKKDKIYHKVNLNLKNYFFI